MFAVAGGITKTTSIPLRRPGSGLRKVPRNEHPPFRRSWRYIVAKKTTRRRYTAAEKKNILTTAAKEGLTGADVQKKFGIAQLTFYRWRGPVRGPKARARAAAGSRPAGGASNLDAIRAEVRAGVRAVVPQVIREEVANYLNEILGKRGPGRPKGTGRGPGRPKGSGRGPGRPPKKK